MGFVSGEHHPPPPHVNKYRDNNAEVQFNTLSPPNGRRDLRQSDQPRDRYTHWRLYQYARWRIIRTVNIFKNHLLKKKVLALHYY
jgi:hypothetical protein